MLDKDLLIITHLRKNSRETLTSMSRLTKIPVSTLYDKLKQQEASLIQKHTSIVDFSKLGFNTRIHMLVKVDREKREELQAHLVKEQNVNSLYRVNSGYDFLIEGVFRHVKDMEDFIEKLEEKFELRQKQLYYIIADIKREEFLANPEIAGRQALEGKG
ncbi:MAG: Lrp/AsnC ligand binding domain-containing protein [Candidatus Woesearchaeota archaeon]